MKATAIGRGAEDGDGRRSGTCSLYCLSRDIDLPSSAFFGFDDAACVCDAFQCLYPSIVMPPDPRLFDVAGWPYLSHSSLEYGIQGRE